MKCFYCNNKGIWYNPYEHAYYCKEHARKKMNDYIEEFNRYESDTLKDWFIQIVDDDPNLLDVTLNTKTGEVTKNADNSW